MFAIRNALFGCLLAVLCSSQLAQAKQRSQLSRADLAEIKLLATRFKQHYPSYYQSLHNNFTQLREMCENADQLSGQNQKSTANGQEASAFMTLEYHDADEAREILSRQAQLEAIQTHLPKRTRFIRKQLAPRVSMYLGASRIPVLKYLQSMQISNPVHTKDLVLRYLRDVEVSTRTNSANYAGCAQYISAVMVDGGVR